MEASCLGKHFRTHEVKRDLHSISESIAESSTDRGTRTGAWQTQSGTRESELSFSLCNGQICRQSKLAASSGSQSVDSANNWCRRTSYQRHHLRAEGKCKLDIVMRDCLGR
jgi:hypothetical protein